MFPKQVVLAAVCMFSVACMGDDLFDEIGQGGGGVGGTVDPGGQGSGNGASCLQGVTDFGTRGPFNHRSANSGRVKIEVPVVPAGCKVPVVHLANGTGASCFMYGAVLDTLASHGFIAACYETTNTGSGVEGLEAIRTVYRNHSDIAGPMIGSAGHSQGGQAAFVVQQLAESEFGAGYKYAGLAMEPASGFGDQPRSGSWRSVYSRIQSPMFMFSGTADILVSRTWVSLGFNALNDQVEAYHWSARGATHIPVPNRVTQEVAVPWFRWKLLGDQNACRAFKNLLGGLTWSEVDSQNVASCQ